MQIDNKKNKRGPVQLPRLKPRNDKVTVNRHIFDSFQQIFIYLFFKIKKYSELINEDYIL